LGVTTPSEEQAHGPHADYHAPIDHHPHSSRGQDPALRQGRWRCSTQAQGGRRCPRVDPRPGLPGWSGPDHREAAPRLPEDRGSKRRPFVVLQTPKRTAGEAAPQARTGSDGHAWGLGGSAQRLPDWFSGTAGHRRHGPASAQAAGEKLRRLPDEPLEGDGQGPRRHECHRRFTAAGARL